MNVESLIILNLLLNEEYTRKVIPFLDVNYFTELPQKNIFYLANDYIQKYNSLPNFQILLLDLEHSTGLNEADFRETKNTILKLRSDVADGRFVDERYNLNYLLDVTEKWCKDRAIHLALLKSISIIEDKHGARGTIPQVLTDALSVSFDSHIGHDYLENSLERFEFYHRKEKKIPFDLDYLNRITNGGLPQKTLTIILAGINIGKSAFMCHNAAAHLSQGYNVLYITLEMAEEKIAERIDLNLLDLTLSELRVLPKDVYEKRIERLQVKGRLIIKEYPTTCAGVTHFRHLLNELKIKKNFVPDIIYVDYINLCISSRFKHGSSINLYGYIKSIAEELRGLAVEYDVPIISATQLTRTGFTSTDVGMEDTAESFGLPATADYMFALLRNDELSALNQVLVKQLKNRYNNLNLNKKFIIGFDNDKMKFYDVEQIAQTEIVDESKRKKKKSDKFSDFH